MTTATAATPSRSSARRRGSRGWWLATAGVVTLILIPPLSLLWLVISSGTGSVIPTGRMFELATQTISLAAAVTATALIMGSLTAWLCARTDLRGRRVWTVLAAIPLVVPSYMAALTVIGATGQRGVLAELMGVVIPVPYGFLGAWLALSLFLTPIVHLIVVPALRRMDPALEEAARGLGASPRKVFRTVTLTQLRPALVSAGLLVGLYTLSDFGAVSLFRYDTLTRAIYTLYAGQIDRRPAATLSVVLMGMALAVLFVERRFRTGAAYGSTTLKRKRRPQELTGVRLVLGTALMATYVTLTVILPITVLVFWLLRGISEGQAVGSILDESFRSLGVSMVAAVLAPIVALPVAMTTTWRRGRFSGPVETSVWAVYSLPHITMGIAVVGLSLVWARPLYQTVGLLTFTYVAMFLAQSMSSVQDSLRRMPASLEEASRGLGRGPLQTLRRITIPIAMPGLTAGAALVFLSVMKELPATLLLRPNGFETLAIRIWSSTGEGFYTRASLASLALLAVSIVPLLALTNRDLSN